MKKNFTFAMLLMSMCLFTACSSDNDDEVLPPYDSSSISRKLCGGWYRQQNNMTTDILFWDNGKMYYRLTNHAGPSSDYSWNYNDNTGILATTAGYQGTNEYLNLQWEVTLVDSTAWTGIMLYGNKGTQKFSRASSLFEARTVLNARTWVNTKDHSEWTPEPRNNYFRMSNGKVDINIIPDYYVRVDESIAQDKIFIREFSTSSASKNNDLSKVIYECIIDHPYSYNNVRVSCKWVSNYGDGYHSDLYLKPKN